MIEIRSYGKPKHFRPGCCVRLKTDEKVLCNIEMPGYNYVVAVAEDGRQWIVQPVEARHEDVLDVEQL